MRRGTKFDVEKFMWTPEQERDEDVDTTCGEVTLREFLRAVIGITGFLKYTLEREEDFGDRLIPTLDFKIGVDLHLNRYTHTYYEKPMNCRWVIPYSSAMDPSTKRQIPTNEMRRLLRVDPQILEEEAHKVINSRVALI